MTVVFSKAAAFLRGGALSEAARRARWILSYARGSGGRLLLYVLLGTLGTGLTLAASVLAKYLIDAVTVGDSGNIAPLAALCAAACIFRVAAGAAANRVGEKFNIRVRQSMTADVYGKLMSSDVQRLSRYHSGDMLTRLTTDVSSASSGVLGILPPLITRTLQFAGSFFIIMYFDPAMAAIALAAAPLTVAVSGFMTKRLRAYSKKNSAMNSEMTAFGEESLSNLMSVREFGMEERFTARLSSLLFRQRGIQLDYNRFVIISSSVMSLFGMAVSGLCCGWGVYRLWSGFITFGTMTLFLQLASSLSSAFSSIISLVPTAISAGVAASRIMEITGADCEKARASEASELSELCADSGISVRADGLNFCYDGREEVIKNVNFEVLPGEALALTGASGEGKTTVLRLILGVLRPTAGKIILTDGRGVSIPAGRDGVKYIAYVPQDTSIFSGTVAENLRLAAAFATDGEIEQALKAAEAWNFVSKMPQGINTALGERGNGLSQGQRQRLAIARALLTEKPVLLLDEATSALDLQTEAQIIRNLFSGASKRTCILTSHRSAVLDICTKACPARGTGNGERGLLKKAWRKL